MAPVGQNIFHKTFFIQSRLISLYQVATLRQDVCTIIYILLLQQSLLAIIRDLFKGGRGGSNLLRLAASEIRGAAF